MSTAVGRRSRSGTDWLRSQVRRIGEGPVQPVTAEVAATVEVESWLQSHGVQYAPPAPIPMSLIDVKASRTNQARRDPIVAESVDRFCTAMRAGVAFPPIVVYPNGGKLVIVDGNNRQASAARVGVDTINGIVLSEETPSEVIHLLTVEANARHGVTPELAWRIQQAFGLSAMGWSDAQAAEAAGLSPAQLRSARTVQDADQRARGLKLGGFLDLPASSKVALVAVKDDAVFFALAKLATSTGMTTDEIREVTRALRGLNSEGARLEFVAKAAKVRAVERRPVKHAQGKHPRLHSPKSALAAGIGKVLGVKPEDLVRQIVTRHDRELIEQRLDELDRKLDVIRAAMNALPKLDGE